MTLVDSWTSNNAVAATTTTTTVPRAVSAGRFVAVAVTTNNAITHNTLTDTRGNTWVRDYQQSYTTIFTTSLWKCRLTTGLQAGDVLTLTTSASSNRHAFVGAVFDDVTTGALDAERDGAASQSTGTATAGPVTTTGDALILLLSGSTSNGVMTTPQGGLTLVGATATNGGSAERSVGLAYKYVTGVITQSGSATLNASATWLAGLAAYRYTAPVTPPTSSTALLYDGSTELVGDWSLWDGSAEITLTASLWDGTSELTLS